MNEIHLLDAILDWLQENLYSVVDSFYDGVAKISIDFPHWRIHKQNSFAYINAIDFTNGQLLSFILTVGDKVPHFLFEVDGEAEYDIQIFEGATPQADGTLVTDPPVINRYRPSTNTSEMTIKSGPTLGAGSKGSLILHFHAGSGKSNGGASGTRDELPLKPNTKYWIDVLNSTSSNNYLSWVVDWYYED